MDEITLYIIFVSLLIFSGLYSSSETAFLVSSKIKSHIWKKQNRRNSSRLFNYISNPERFLITILVGNNFVNIAYTSIGTILLVGLFSEETTMLILASLLLVFGEIFPKTIATAFADKFILLFVPIVRLLELVFYPLILITEFISEKTLKQSVGYNETVFTRHDIRSLITETKFSDHFNADQEKYFQNIFKLSHTPVKDIMVPRTDIIAIDKDDPVDKLYELFEKGGFSKIPVYSESMDQIMGLVFIYSILDKRPENLSEVIEKPLFVPENKRCSDLLYTLKKEKKSVAIVIDEYGGTAGLVTIHSLLNYIVGSLQLDEFSPATSLSYVFQINQNTYRISGRAKKEELTKLGLSYPDGDFETVAGLILYKLGSFPELHEKIKFNGFSLTVISLSKNRIQWIKLNLDDIEK